MARPKTLLEGLCGHAMLFGATSIRVERKDRHDWVFAVKDDLSIRIGNYSASGADAKELRENLRAAARRPVRAVIEGKVYLLRVCVFDGMGEDTLAVNIDPAPKLDPSVAPRFTAKQGQYLAFIYNYSKIHRQSPSEADMERHFRVSPPSVHEMIKTLERNGLIERTAGQARSIRLLIQPEHIPRLG